MSSAVRLVWIWYSNAIAFLATSTTREGESACLRSMLGCSKGGVNALVLGLTTNDESFGGEKRAIFR